MPLKGEFASHCKRGHARIPENLYSDNGCRLCCKLRSAAKVEKILAWEKANPEEHANRMRSWTATSEGKRSVRNTKLKQQYGITLEEYEKLLESQGGKCAICPTVLDSSQSTTIPHVDHVHNQTGRIRGLLCLRCNLGLGSFRDNPQLLKRAVDYLRYFEARP